MMARERGRALLGAPAVFEHSVVEVVLHGDEYVAVHLVE